METKHTSTGKAALQHGLMLGGALIILSLILHFAGVTMESWSRYLSWVIMVAYLIYATKNFRDEHRGGYLKYGNGLGFGTLVSLVSGSVSAVYMVLYVKVINNEFINEIMNNSYEQFVERGMSDEQIEMIMTRQESWMMPSMLIGALIGTTFIGFLLSLIISAVFKRTED